MAMRMRSKVALGMFAATVMLVAGCSPSTPSEPADKGSKTATAPVKPQTGHALVKITDTAFDPATITVKAGARVVWTNDGKQPHDITLDQGGASSGALQSGKSANHEFKTAGKFAYHDSSNPEMKGVVIVEP